MNWINQQLKKQRYICNICNNPLNGASVDRINGGNDAHLKSLC